MVSMPKDSSKLLPVQEFIGLQVIDSKGSLVGTVKDVSLDLARKYIALRITTKSKGEIDIGWDDVQSVEDVVLLKKLVDSSATITEAESSPVGEETVQAMIICPSCGASSAARAKFCSKCGMSLKS